MQGINQLLLHSSTFILLEAPIAWGKTSLLLELYQKRTENNCWIFVSPLKALAMEFHHRLEQEKIPSYFLSGPHFNSSEANYFFKKNTSGFLILTAESYYLLTKCNEYYRWDDVTIVFDEFHLWFYWGDSFRPKLWDAFFFFFQDGKNYLALTATFNTDFHTWVNDIIPIGFENIFWIRPESFALKFLPSTVYRYSAITQWMMWDKLELSLELYPEKCFLIFCSYRIQVYALEKHFSRKKIKVLACVGGETVQFREKLKICPRPQCIVSTLALGHGVNLPIFDEIFILYPVENYDFWLQMVGRGGRKGESYVIHHRDRFQLPKVKTMNWFNCLVHYCQLLGKKWKQK